MILRLMHFSNELSLSLKVAIKTVSDVKSWHVDLLNYLVNRITYLSFMPSRLKHLLKGLI